MHDEDDFEPEAPEELDDAATQPFGQTDPSSTVSVEFLEGFENGLSIRDSPEQFAEYGCPDQQISQEHFDSFKSALNPIRGTIHGKDI